jgi:hypothetical protein
MSQNLQNTALTQVGLVHSSCFQSCNVHLTKLYQHHLKKKKILCCELFRVIEFVPLKFISTKKRYRIILMIQMTRCHFKTSVTVLFQPCR